MAETEAGPFESTSVPEGYRQHLEPVIFIPWARRLIEFVRLDPDQVVLDVASGTGVVARAAAHCVGVGGRVIASDISPAMLAHVTTELADNMAEVQTLECSATDLLLPDGSVDVVLCQQGFPFIPDRVAAAKEMHRVLRPGGRIGVAVWLSGARLDPFETYVEVLKEEGIPEPFPRAYDVARFTMSVDEVEQVLIEGDFRQVDVIIEVLELEWDSPEAAALGIAGTPFGPSVNAVNLAQQRKVMSTLRQRMTSEAGATVRHVMTAVLGRGIAD